MAVIKKINNLPVLIYEYSGNIPENMDVLLQSGWVDPYAPDTACVEEATGFCNADSLLSNDCLFSYDNSGYGVGCYVRYKRTVSNKDVAFEAERELHKRRVSGEFISKTAVKEIKERIKITKLRDTTPRATKIPFIFDDENKRLYILTANVAFADKLQAKLSALTSISFYPVTALQYVPENKEVDDIGEVSTAFLSWLWMESDEKSDLQFKSCIDSNKTYTTQPGDIIKVKTPDGSTCSVRGDIREAKNGVFNGKKVDQYTFSLFTDGYIATVAVNPDLSPLRISLGEIDIDTDRGELEDEIRRRFIIGTVKEVQDFLKSAYTEFFKVYSNEKAWQAKQEEMFNWSRGDVCMKTFADI